MVTRLIGGKDYVAGKTFTVRRLHLIIETFLHWQVADIALGFILNSAKALGWVDEHPEINEYVKRVTVWICES